MMDTTVTKRCLQKCRVALVDRLRGDMVIHSLIQDGILNSAEAYVLKSLDNQESAARLLDMLENKDEIVINKLIRIIRQHLRGMNSLANQLQHEYAVAKGFPNVSVAGTGQSVVTIGGTTDFRVDLEILDDILTKVGTRKVVVLSFNGRTRGGKSFICTQLLKYMKYGINGEEDDWVYMTLEEAFLWRQGTRRCTAGIQIWSEPLLVKDNNGDEVALILMDCQGLFDSQTEERGNALIFAFSVLLSSCFIFNDKNISEDVFNFMNMFLQFAQVANRNRTGPASKLLQKFMFLARDWQHQSEYSCGYYDRTTKPDERDQNLIDLLFGDNQGQTQDARDTRRIIRALSGETCGFAMCHPCVIPDFNVDPSDWTKEFRNQVVALVTKIISPVFISQSLKMVGNEEVTGEDLKIYVRSWANILQDSDSLPDIQSILATTSQLQGTRLVKRCQDIYEAGMNLILLHNPDGMVQNIFDQSHNQYLSEAIAALKATILIGENATQDYELILRNAIYIIRANKWETNCNNVRMAAEREEAERIAEEERVQREAAEAETERIRQARIDAAEIALQEAHGNLERTKSRLENVKSNRAAFNYVVTEMKKETNRILGFKGTPSYRPIQVVKFNDAQYNAAVQSAAIEVEHAEQRVTSANTALENARL